MKTENKNYKGVIVPMITPFNEDLSLDLASVRRILDTFIEANVSVFILCTTGESISMSEKQKLLLVKTACEYLNGKIKIYAGISGNCLSESIGQAKSFSQLGVNVVVAHLPFYYPMESNQMLSYFKQLADNVNCPLILYNIPATTKQSIPLNVIDQLSHHPNIVGIKDSEKGIERIDESLRLWRDRSDFVHLTGCAVHSTYSLQEGSAGLVPSTANLVPKLYRDLYETVIAGDISKAKGIQDKTDRISEIYQKGRNLSQSIPALKTMMSAYGLCKSFVLPPMVSLDTQQQKLIIEKIIAETNDVPGPGL
jgi:dihydrodipicolinate synthase/N-acetylneuraminate lyase